MKKFLSILLFLIIFLLCQPVKAQALYGALVQTNHFSAENNAIDVVSISNTVPTQSTLIIFETFEATSAMVPLNSLTNSSNYNCILQGYQNADSVHNQSIYTMYCSNGLSIGANIGIGYTGTILSARAYCLVYCTGVSSTNQPNIAITNDTYGSTTAFNIITTNTNCIVIGMFTSDGVPTVASGANVGLSTTGVTLIGNLDTNIGYVFNSTSGLVSGYFYTNAPTISTYTATGYWVSNNPVGPTNKSISALMVALNPAATSTFYIDYVSGNDANQGNIISSPFQHCPGDSNATLNVLTTIASSGDTFIFKGGESYIGLIQITNSGTLNNPIIYDGNSANTFGTGMAVIDCNSNLYHAFAAPHLINYANNIIITNFNIEHLKNNNDYQNQWVNTVPYSQDTVVTTNLINYGGDGSGYDQGGVFIYGTGWAIGNCLFHETQNWGYRSLANGNTTNTIQCQQIGIDLYQATNVFITNCQVWDIGRSCIQNYDATNVFITGCNFGGPSTVALTNRGWFAVAVEGSAYTETITNCLIHDGWQREGDDLPDTGYSSGQRDHAGDWLHFFGNGDGVENFGDNINITVVNCFLYNDYAFQTVAGTGDIYIEQDAWNMQFYNNIIINPHHMVFWISGGVVSNINFYNNLCLSANPTNSAQETFYIDEGRNVNATNNIFINLSANSAALPFTMLNSAVSSNNFSDYNIFYNPLTISYGVVRNQGVDQSLSQWTTATGNDSHSIVSNPNFVNGEFTANGALSSSGNYNLSSSSVALNAGFNLKTYFTIDYLNNPRPISGVWDIGPYQTIFASGNILYYYIK